MIKLLIFLCLVGTGFYLLAPFLAPQERAAEIGSYVQSPAAAPVPTSVTSWGSSLRTLRSETVAQESAQRPPPSDVTGSLPEQDIEMQTAQPAPIAEPIGTPNATPSASLEKAPAPAVADLERDTIEWVKLTATVRTRSEASVSSPGLWSYPAGSKAHVVGRADGWVQLRDPRTEARGWVYHAYLAPIDAAPTETASAPPPAQVVSPTLQEPARAAEPADRAAESVARAAAPVKVRKAKRQRRGLFKRRRAQRAWSLGPAR